MIQSCVGLRRSFFYGCPRRYYRPYDDDLLVIFPLRQNYRVHRLNIKVSSAGIVSVTTGIQRTFMPVNKN